MKYVNSKAHYIEDSMVNVGITFNVIYFYGLLKLFHMQRVI